MNQSKHRTAKQWFCASIFLWVGFLLSGCSTAPRMVKVEFHGSIWSQGQQQAGVLFQDGAQSIPVNGGTLWLFGDTFFGKPPVSAPPDLSESQGACGTTIAFMEAGRTNLPPHLNYFLNASGAVTNPLSLFRDETPERFRIWPLGGIGIGPNVYLYYSMIEKTAGPGPWNFRGVGGGLAVAEGPLQPFKRLRPGGNWRFPVEPIQVLHEGRTLYLFEISSRPKGLILARVAEEQVENPAAYEFLDGDQWTTNRAAAKVVLREAYGQVSVVWSPALRCYLMATSSDFFHPLEIQLRTARRPEGPWSPPLRIAVPDLPGETTTLVYGTFLHPELSCESSPHFIATFCRTLKGEWKLSNPEWVTFTLSP